MASGAAVLTVAAPERAALNRGLIGPVRSTSTTSLGTLIMPNTCRCDEPYLASVQVSAVYLRVLKTAMGGDTRSTCAGCDPNISASGCTSASR